MGKKRIIAKSTNEGEIAKSSSQEVKTKQRLSAGRIYIQATYNNTILTLTDEKGNVLFWSSAGRLGFRGAKKATPFVASRIAEALVQVARKIGISDVEVYINGVGSGREGAVRAISAQGMNIILIKDITPIPHNGPKPPKVRRV